MFISLSYRIIYFFHFFCEMQRKSKFTHRNKDGELKGKRKLLTFVVLAQYIFIIIDGTIIES